MIDKTSSAVYHLAYEKQGHAKGAKMGIKEMASKLFNAHGSYYGYGCQFVEERLSFYPDNRLTLCCMTEDSGLDICNIADLRGGRLAHLSGIINDYAICAHCRAPECTAIVDITPFRQELLQKYMAE